MDTGQKILLRRNRKILASNGTAEKCPEFVASLTKNLESIGFTFSSQVIERLLTWTPEELLALAQDIVPLLLKEIGGHVRYRPMYPNFPEQIMVTEEAELYLNAIRHYYGDAVGRRILPEYDKKTRAPLGLPTELRVIQLGEPCDIRDICRALILSNTSLSKSDQNDLKDLLACFRHDIESVLPKEIPFKEVVAVVCSSISQFSDQPAELISRYIRTVTDVLRFATDLSGGDTSLAGSTRYRSMSRKERRVILGLLESIHCPLEDLIRHRGKWIRLSERLHPGDYSKRFPVTFRAITALRNDEPVETFYSRMEDYFRQGKYCQAANLLKSRPGEFARRLDHLLRSSSEDNNQICESFAEVASSVSTPVLLQVIAHFKHRALDQVPKQLADIPKEGKIGFFETALKSLTNPVCSASNSPMEPMRTIFPKGQVGKLVRIPSTLRLIDPVTAGNVVIVAEQALKERFSKLPSIGNAFLEPELSKYAVPFSQRSASKSLRTLARGSRIKIRDANTLRLFLWWREGAVDGKKTGRVDLDLSATFYRENWSYLDHVSYTNLKTQKVGACHSGDITSAPGGASEFIDIDIKKAQQAGGRYVVCSVQSFTAHPYCNLPECFVGWMARDKPQSGEVYEPATVKDKVDLASDRRISIPMVIDLCERDVVWADLALQSLPNQLVNIESNQCGLVHYGAAITQIVKPNLFDLFLLHVQARGSVVDSIGEADTIFSVAEGITPYDFETIVSEYLVSSESANQA